MKIASAIGLRYSHARRGSKFVGLNAILSVLGITIGIAALIVVLSVMNGVMTQVRNGVLSFTAHMTVRPFGVQVIDRSFDPSAIFQKFPQITGWAPYVQGQGLIGSGDKFQGILLQGVDANRQGAVSTTFDKLPAAIKNQLTSDSFNIIIGDTLAEQINVKVGDKITVVVPLFSTTGAGLFPRLKRFTVVGTFHSGNQNFDSGYTFISSNNAATLFQLPEGYSGWQIMLKNPMDAEKIREDLRQQLPNYTYISDWTLDNASYFNAVQLEKNAMFIILSLIILVALFSLLSTMYMVVTEKRRDIAILRTMGMTRRDILRIFITQGMVFGAFGTVLGTLTGVFISLNVPYLMNKLEQISGVRIDKTMYFVESLSAEIDPTVVWGVAALTLGFTLIFSIVPALIAARTQPARALSAE